MKKPVIIGWRCTAPKQNDEGRFNRKIFCKNEAIYNNEFGWICDCGRWTKGDDDYHKPLRKGFREVIDCRKLREGVNTDNILQIQPKQYTRYLKDKSICESCDVQGCPGLIRFEKEYYDDIGIPVCNETNLPMCPHVCYKEARG